MKKITSIIVAFMMLATLFTALPVSAESDVWGSAEVATAFAGGTGTSADPYQISNAAELRYANNMINSDATYADAYYVLTADIDMGGSDWVPLGWNRPTHYDTSTSTAVYTPAFTGGFDGAKHIISNIKIDWDANHALSKYMGFFGYCKGASITNLGLNNVEIVWVNNDYVYDSTNNKTIRVSNSGVLAGWIVSSTVSNCYVTNSKIVNTNSGKNDSAIGGLIGSLDWGNSVSDSFVYNVNIRAGQLAVQCGFIGNFYSSNNNISNCYAAKISCDQDVNYATTYGFAYSNGKSQNVSECYSTMNDIQGDHISKSDIAVTYDPAKSLGKTGMTTNALIQAMTATGVYAQSDLINGGYPYLKANSPAVVAATAYAGGKGTAEEPYLISTPAELLFAVNKINDGTHNTCCFKLTGDIEFNGQEWTPIGTDTNKFKGSFDGDGHKISGISISGTPALEKMGLFGYVGTAEGTTIKNLGVENINISFKHNTGKYAGGLAAVVDAYTVIENCYVKNSEVKYDTDFGSNATLYIGSFIGMVRTLSNETSYEKSPVIKNCYSYGVAIKAARDRRVSGFVGHAFADYAAQFVNCYVANVVIPSGYADASADSGIWSTLYAFMNKGGSEVYAENCYSTLTGGKGSQTYSSTYTAENELGKIGAQLSDITKGFEENELFEVSDGINGGEYPHLWYETAPVTPDYTITSVNKAVLTQSVTGSKGSYAGSLAGEQEITVTITRKTGVTDAATVYIASYDMDGRLIKAAKADVDKDEFSFPADVDYEKATTIKVFLWDANQSELAEPYKAISQKASNMMEEWPYIGEVAERKTNVITIGDSLTDSVWTGSSYSWPKSGWEKYITDYLDTDEVALVKHGHGGWTMKDFIDGKTSYHYCDWETIKTEFAMGDYVIIALGTNDESQISKYNDDPTKGYSAEQFKNWYKAIAADVEAKGAHLIVLTPPPSHDEISDGEFYSTSEWLSTKALLELEREVNDITVIDIGEAFAVELNELIDAGTYTVEDLIIQKDASGTVTGPGAVYVDSVHFSEYGADLLAKVIAEQIALRTTGLEDFIVLPVE